MKKDINVETPTVPNFIRVKIGDVETTQPLTFFTDLELREIVEKWKEKLFLNKDRQFKESKK